MRIRVKDTTLWVETLGEGAPLLCLHGGLGLDHTYFRPWLDPLSIQSRLVYYDQRGNGRSARPENWPTVDHRVWVNDIDALRRVLGLERIFLLGHSYGGYFAIEYALDYPEYVLGLILCDTSPAADHDDLSFTQVAQVATAEQLSILETAFSQPFRGSAEELGETFRTILSLYFHEPTPERLDGVTREMTFSPAAFNRSFIECRPHFDVTSRLGEITAPTLVLSGRHDVLVPPSAGAERLHSRISGSELVVFEYSGHFPFVEEQERFLEVVKEWLRRVG